MSKKYPERNKLLEKQRTYLKYGSDKRRRHARNEDYALDYALRQGNWEDAESLISRKLISKKFVETCLKNYLFTQGVNEAFRVYYPDVYKSYHEKANKYPNGVAIV